MRYCSHCVMPDTRPGIKFHKAPTGGGGIGFVRLVHITLKNPKQTMKAVLKN